MKDMKDKWLDSWITYLELKGWLGKERQAKARYNLANWKVEYRKVKYTTIRHISKLLEIPYHEAEAAVEEKINKHPIGRKRNKLAMEKD